MLKIVEKLEYARRKRDLLQSEVALKAGLQATRISKWLADEGEPSARQAWKLAKALGVGLRWMLDDDAPIEDWDQPEGLTPIESHLLYLSQQLGEDNAAKLLTDELMRRGAVSSAGGVTAGGAGDQPTPTGRDVTPEKETRKKRSAPRTRKRRDNNDPGSSPGPSGHAAG